MLAEAATPEVSPVSFREAFSVSTEEECPAVTGARCSGCRLRPVCLWSGLSEAAERELGSLAFAHRRLKLGQALYRSGEPFQAIYLVRSGFIKTVVLLEDGREQVTGLYMPGETLGMDGIASARHASDAIALEDGDVCVVPYDRLEALSREASAVQRHLHRLFSKEIVREQRMMLLLGSMRAEERVAAFLLNLSERFTALGFSPSEFVLRMTREEIGSLLGMKLETVSRIFSRFHKDRLIEIEGKHVRIVSSAGLRRIIGH
ncbi:MAG TPA: helix-turn-helix domain-containing protein [Burkholderiales bacterium]|nr:helix-turn-helix domain-containing protein [Burkholderiales bacterium]